MDKKKLEPFLFYCICFVTTLCVLVKLLIEVILNGINVFKVKERIVPPAILIDPRWGKHSYMQLKGQGLKLHYVEKGDSSKPLLLLLHGFPECWFSWRHQLEELSSDYWVVAVDMRGYGDSDKPKGLRSYKLSILVEDIREFITELGKPKCTLIAHDWGGVIAWRLVKMYPELFEKHISISGPHSRIMRTVLRSSFDQFKSSWYIFFFNCPFLPEIMMRLGDLRVYADTLKGPRNLVEAFPEEVLEGYKYYYSRAGAFSPPLNYYRAREDYIRAPSDDAKAELISVPTLILWCEEDIFLTRPVIENAVSVCKEAKFEVISGASHFVMGEKPKELNELILNYISGN